MSGFVATPAAPAGPQMIQLGGFWPALDLTHFREAMRIGSTMLPVERVKQALLAGAMGIADELALWRAEQTAAGHAQLAAIPAELWAGQSRLVLLWQRAVYALAAAELLETHRDLTVTDPGSQRATMNGETADDHRRTAIRAVRSLQGKSGTAVELI